MRCTATRIARCSSRHWLSPAILRDLPHNTQLKADVMIPNTSAASPVNQEMRENWGFTSGWGYVRLAPGADPNAVLAKFRTVIDRSVNPMKLVNVRERGSDLLAPHLTPFVDGASFDRPLWRHDAAGQLDHGLWFFRHRRADPADGLLQFHQPGHRAGDDAGPRDRLAQGGGGQARAADRPVPGRGL